MNVIADHEFEKEITNPSKSVEKGKLPKMPNYKSKKISKRSQLLTNTKINKNPLNCKRAIYGPVPSTSGLNIINDKPEKDFKQVVQKRVWMLNMSSAVFAKGSYLKA